MSDQNLKTSAWWEQYRDSVDSGTKHEVELLLRSPAPTLGGHERRKQIFERIEDATRSGLIDGYDVTVLGDALCLCRTCAHTPVGERLLGKMALLQDWGTESASVDAFEERQVESDITNETYRVLVPPELCLCISVDDNIEGVFPCTIDGVSYGLESYLDAVTDEPVQPQTSTVDT